jgi:tetratricopeptide (TPR) repeat protein
MKLFDKIKKSIQLKQNNHTHESIQKIHKKISQLEKQLEGNPDNYQILTDLYRYHVETSNTTKKIDYLKKMSKISPNDSYPLQQLADIYSNELVDVKLARNYQDKVNEMSKSF